MDRPSVSLSVWWQYLMGQLFYMPMIWVIWGVKLLRLRIQDHAQWRKYYRELLREGEAPLIICPNHLTYIDSIMLIYAFGSHGWYFLNFKKHMWNLVAKEYRKNPLFRFVCFFSKCLYLDRDSEKQSNYPTLKTALNLLRMGEVVLIFPEGRRSKTGRFDDARLAYGVGKLVADLGECRVLCVYSRAPQQSEKSTSFPPPGSTFRIFSELVHYRASEMGPQPVAAITQDIAVRIKKLEENYFASLSA